ncbi:hypothetical protein J2X20_002775 [Pelomonas saccharophila]|uniref:HNH nuclease domain-containing protein n=1 Tax=Roseateles saccharophilus TaxID=304 RepID=A0ABU1YMP1_ROSSA|nr:HNH endonuclease [Roseateles saccharophilus]MDR7270117.1 hypothetical protein [Roseateles saccharophilus]
MAISRPSKYDPLIDHLKSLGTHEVKLTFAEIDALLGDKLPPAALQYPAWWANSPTDPTHSWARRWTAAGWLARVDLANERVTFERAGSAPPPMRLIDLRPTHHEPVMDLVERAGIDVSGWALTADNVPVANPRANPNYCYNWSFGSPMEGFVLCLWYDELSERDSQIVSDNDMGHHLQTLERLRSEAGPDAAKRSRLSQQIRRAQEFLYAVEESRRRNQPLQVIINAGVRRDDVEIGEASSRVAFRELDYEPWYVHGHDEARGRWLIVRGVRPGADEDSTPLPVEDDTSPGADDARRLGTIRVRRGQAKFRADLIGAYGGKCAVTGTRIEELLEAAHIVPHAQGTNYRISNGLLLRADIHTLYDLHLLSVDDRYRVHLSKRLMLTDYLRYHGAELRSFPTTSAQQPSSIYLKERHDRFIAEESAR